ncbi:MAG: hypothetical protein RL156_1723 [Bacteroidota bacterium]|jgi:nucleoid-associated protein YejK
MEEMTDLEEVLAERGSKYGEFSKNSMVSQLLKSTLYNVPRNAAFSHYQREALDMIANKLSRIVCGDPNYADSWRDIAGYATLVADILESRK